VIEDRKLHLKKVFHADRSRVFDAWIKPDLMVQWLAPGDMSVASVTCEGEVGGSYRIEMGRVESSAAFHNGQFMQSGGGKMRASDRTMSVVRAYHRGWTSKHFGEAARLLSPKDGQVQQDVVAKWAANAPLAFVDQYIGNLKQYKAIAIDIGDQDGLRLDAKKLHDILDSYGIPNSFEIYPGTHTSAVAVRFQNFVMPFFSKNLCSGKTCQ
jgi:hypothetical protein